jgi:cold shock protein
MQGKVKFYTDRGWGFIAGSDGKDYFLHFRQWKSTGDPEEGDLVSFDPERTEKGLQALNTERLKDGDVMTVVDGAEARPGGRRTASTFKHYE